MGGTVSSFSSASTTEESESAVGDFTFQSGRGLDLGDGSARFCIVPASFLAILTPSLVTSTELCGRVQLRSW